jgi:hypothetical protein
MMMSAIVATCFTPLTITLITGLIQTAFVTTAAAKGLPDSAEWSPRPAGLTADPVAMLITGIAAFRRVTQPLIPVHFTTRRTAAQ